MADCLGEYTPVIRGHCVHVLHDLEYQHAEVEFVQTELPRERVVGFAVEQVDVHGGDEEWWSAFQLETELHAREEAYVIGPAKLRSFSRAKASRMVFVCSAAASTLAHIAD